ncbi:MAG: lamin tail domain-containing protein [Labilithrix sp.]|nr:lamin tail domain-containing protein [Labilithrix sp.]
MARFLGPLATAGAVAFALGGALSPIVVGCAMSDPADLSPSVDPSLPGLDASNNPLPAMGDAARPDTGSPEPVEDAGSGDATPTIVADAGADTGPATAPKPAPGEVLITEVMYDSLGPEPGSEWIEIHNKATSERTLTGLTIKDGANRTHTIGAGVKIAAGAYALLVRSKTGAATAKVPASVVLYEYGTGLPDTGGVLLANGANGAVSLLNGPVAITSAQYGGWYSQSGGSSVQLKVVSDGQGATPASWCLSLNAWATGSDKGTPGAPQDCP